MDLWTNRQMRSFSGITAHFILNWQMESVILGCTRFKGHHFTFMDESRSNRSEPRHQKRELQEYLEEPCVDEEMNPLTYWIQNQSVYPSLSVIAQRVLGIPSSSAAVERLFSIAGKVFRPERCRLTDCTFNKLMFVKCNNKFFKQ